MAGFLDETVHERVRRLRNRRRFSQKALADATDNVVSEAWLQKFEGPEAAPKSPTREQLEPLAEPLGVSLGYLMEPMRVAPLEDVNTEDWERRMWLDQTIADEDRELIADLARRLRRANAERHPQESPDEPIADPPRAARQPHAAQS